MNTKTLLSGLLLAFTLWQWGQAGWIYAKAQLAQYLIADAWQSTLRSQQDSQQPKAPWPWADTWPVARMQVPAHNIDLYVLEGADGSALAFGPGHMQGTALPASHSNPGTSIIGGHRDTHFAFLADIQVGDMINIQNSQGNWQEYRISNTEIKNSETEPLFIQTDSNELLLITCFPFNAISAGGPLRFVVKATLP
ncbi:hypothetical protein R50073_28320 [Maricurvus nonylphenolicus]|uniref:class GN sortase n=1 Tax=Maricurvus nonylphenolicus TaxID=1008307 RepID=UPI0036F29486